MVCLLFNKYAAKINTSFSFGLIVLKHINIQHKKLDVKFFCCFFTEQHHKSQERQPPHNY